MCGNPLVAKWCTIIRNGRTALSSKFLLLLYELIGPPSSDVKEVDI